MFFEIIICVIILKLAIIYLITKLNKREKIDFRGKHVVITGGSSGIGWDLSIDSFKQGAHVSIIARNKDKLNEIKQQLESIKQNNKTFGSQIVQIESVDISKNYEETKKAFDRITAKAGPVDILINNAGIFKCVEFSESSCQDAEDMMRVNYIGSLYCTRAVVESMKSLRFGRIVFVSSQAGQIGIFGYTGYSASKFALRGFAEALQMELKPYGINVSLVYPPDTDTPGLKTENIDKPEETRLIADSSGVLPSKQVAENIISSIKRGSWDCSFGVNGFLLSTLACGAGPAINFKDALIQIIALPLCRFIAIILTFTFDNTVKSCYTKKLRT